MKRSVLMLVTMLGALGMANSTEVEPAAADRVRANDNRRPAGILRGDTLKVRLVARVAMWHPHGERDPGTPMAAFAEEGGAAQIPGPLIRVRAGTEARVSVKNRLSDTLRVYGLVDRLAGVVPDTQPVVLAPGAESTVRVRLETPGTFYYWGTSMRRSIDFRTLGDAQLTGALVVDPRGAPPSRDRIFVIGMWTDTVHRSGVHRTRVLGVINGRSWPNTERLSHTVGDTVRWRVINASGDLHPMHLHGFYFRVDATGDGRVQFPTGGGRAAVTESMSAGATMNLTWRPERAGNWLFHCHIPEHIERRAHFGMEMDVATSAHADHANEGMSGLVLGVTVANSRRSGPHNLTAASDERRMRLLVRPLRGSTADVPRYAYTLHEGGDEPPVGNAGDGPSTLDVVRGQPVHITVVNRLPEPTAVHWHGIELESYYDGVPGFSGMGRRVTPLIAPGDSFVVRFTPPRAGTFIYHTHSDEARQQHAGLAAPLVVREGQAPRDTARDIPILLGEVLGADHSKAVTVVNGRPDGAPIELRVGTTYRLRFVQMSVSRSVLRVEVLRDSIVDQWRPVAKDGADLPPAMRASETARLRIGIGETYDFEFTPAVAGAMRIEVRQGLIWPRPAPLLATQSIVVRP